MEVQSPVPAPGGMSDRTWAMLAHLSSLSMFIGVPMGNIFGPLLVWAVKKDAMPFVDRHGKEALNFGISMTIYLVISGILIFAVVGFFLVPVVLLMALIFPIIAGLAANDGKEYEYPLTIRFVK